MEYDCIDRNLQLHEKVEIVYTVDGFEATLVDEATDVAYMTGTGETIRLAMEDLDLKLIGYTIPRLAARG
jgi:hypothetical protein